MLDTLHDALAKYYSRYKHTTRLDVIKHKIKLHTVSPCRLINKRNVREIKKAVELIKVNAVLFAQSHYTGLERTATIGNPSQQPCSPVS